MNKKQLFRILTTDPQHQNNNLLIHIEQYITCNSIIGGYSGFWI